MSASTPLVTVLIPSFNEESHIVRASLESIRGQTFADFECIVVDESNCPDLAEACRAVCAEDPRFIYFHPQERLGLAKSLNLAIGKARGELIARFDSDDVCRPERLSLQVAFLQEHPNISVVGGSMDIISYEGKFLAHRRYPLNSSAIAKSMQVTNAVAHPTVMFRKKAIELYGAYNPDFRFAEDLELWLRWMNQGVQFANLPQVLVEYRQDNSRRELDNWRFNLRARMSNFSGQHLILRAIGIACIVIWAALPQQVQEKLFNQLIFRGHPRETL